VLLAGRSYEAHAVGRSRRSFVWQRPARVQSSRSGRPPPASRCRDECSPLIASVHPARESERLLWLARHFGIRGRRGRGGRGVLLAELISPFCGCRGVLNDHRAPVTGLVSLASSNASMCSSAKASARSLRRWVWRCSDRRLAPDAMTHEHLPDRLAVDPPLDRHQIRRSTCGSWSATRHCGSATRFRCWPKASSRPRGGHRHSRTPGGGRRLRGARQPRTTREGPDRSRSPSSELSSH